MAERRVVVLDYGSGNVRSAVRMLQRVGAAVTLTADRDAASAADGLYVPGVGNFHACMSALASVGAPALIRRRVEAGAPVLGVCVGHQVLFESSSEPSNGDPQGGIGAWEGRITRLHSDIVPHMGWSPVNAGADSHLFAGLAGQRFYFVHSYAAPTFGGSRWNPGSAPAVSTAEHGEAFVAAVEDGPLCGAQFHPEKSGDAGAALLENWLRML